MPGKILVADDDPDILELLKFSLESQDYQVLLSTNGEDAYQKSVSEKPDLLVLDVMMPKMNGYEVCEKIRTEPTVAQTPIIILTAKGQTKDKITGIKLGADDYMAKPFEPHELVARIEAILRRAKAAPKAVASQAPVPSSAEDEMKARLASGTNFAIGMVDINGFKAFNAEYGPSTGDQILETLRSILQETASERKALVFHRGGDDFLYIGENQDSDWLSDQILSRFESYLEQTKQEFQKSQPSISLAGLSVDPKHYNHPTQILDRLQDFLKFAKSQPGRHVIKGA